MMMNTKEIKTNKIKSQTRDVTTRHMAMTCQTPLISNMAHGHRQTCGPENEILPSREADHTSDNKK